MDMLLALLAAAGVAAGFGWSIPAADGKSLVAVVGKVPAALPTFHIARNSLGLGVQKLLGSAVAISFLGLLEALAVAKSIATYTRQPLDYNRQCLAEGISNLIGGFFQSLAGLGVADALLHQLPVWRGHPDVGHLFRRSWSAWWWCSFRPLRAVHPEVCALAGLLFITAARLIDWRRLGYAVRASRFDAGLVLVTAFAAVFISVDVSILIGVGLSILMFVPARLPGVRCANWW